MTIRRRLLLTFLGLAVLPIAIVAAGLGYGTFRLAERRARESLAAHMDALARLLDAEIRAEKLYLSTIVAEWANPYSPATRGDLAEWLPRRRETIVAFQRETCPASRWIVLGGELESALEIRGVPSANEIVPRTERIDPATLPVAYRGPLSPSPPPLTLHRPTGPVLGLAVPVPEAGGTGGALVEEIPIVVLLDDLLGQFVPRELATCLAASRTGEAGGWSVLYHTDAPRIGLPLPRDEWPVRILGDRPAGADARDGPAWTVRRTGDRLEAAGIHPTTGWLLAGSLSLTSSLGPIRASARMTALSIGIMVLVVTAGILLATRGIGESVREIAQGTGAMAGGDLSRTIRVTRRDEFGAIARHVNEMARELVFTAESRSIARISSRIVHDLKGVASQMNLLVHNLDENRDDPEFRAEFPDLMKGLVGQVETLVLRLRRRDEERAPRWAPVDLAPLVDRALRARLGPTPRIAVRRELPPDCLPVADEELLAEAVDNLVRNAVEAMGDDGELVVRAGRIPPEGDDGGRPTHFLEVEDSGSGMSAEFVRDRLFRPFVTTKPKGLGLGMYHVRRIVTRMGGRIRVESEEGAGTRVRLEIGRGEE